MKTLRLQVYRLLYYKGILFCAVRTPNLWQRAAVACNMLIRQGDLYTVDDKLNDSEKTAKVHVTLIWQKCIYFVVA